MKKKNFLLLALVFFLCSVFYASSVGNGSFATTYETKAEVTYPGVTIKVGKNGNIDDSLVDIAEKELTKIPAEIREKFIASGWAIYITDENLAKTYYNGQHSSVYGITFYNKKLILMENSKVAVETAIIHEVGHWFDNYFGKISESTSFSRIYARESSVFLDEFARGCKMDIGEYFAESFYRYIVDANRMKKVSPQTYSLIDSYAQKMY